ncbi:MAG: PrsW family intramembrane metalloprotease [Anaerolineales bacterium]|nr:PrsW family intramembrane metalloprotease [Anaerolineales bacterium]
MAAQICCVDQVRPGTHAIAGRWFCDEHFKKATYARAGFWRTGLIAIIGLLIFVAAVVALDAALQPQLGGSVLVLTGLLLAIVPAALWLVFFYQQDRLEPEPVGNVARMFVVGLALASAIGLPLTDQLFAVQDWLYTDPLTTWLASIFVTGAVEAFIIFATVRYFIFDSPEFDERTDGVIYGTAAGLGYATALNLQFILANGGSALGSGEVFVAEVALAHAAIGGLLGYFLGRAKLEQDPIWWLPTGLLLAAALNGLFLVLRGQLDSSTWEFAGQGGGLPTFSGLLLAGGLAIVVTAVVSWLMNRDIARSLNNQQPDVKQDPTVGDRQSNYAVIGAFAVCLLVGALVANNAVNRTKTFSVAGFTGAVPADFGIATGDGDAYRVIDSLGTGAEFAIQTPAIEANWDAADVATFLAGERASDYELYKILSSGQTTVNGKPAYTQEFAYVDNNGLTGAAPEVQQGVDYIFVENGRAVVVTMLTTPDYLADVEPQFARFLNSLKF